jgi:secreted trypsin-like serine protease
MDGLLPMESVACTQLADENEVEHTVNVSGCFAGGRYSGGRWVLKSILSCRTRPISILFLSVTR